MESYTIHRSDQRHVVSVWCALLIVALFALFLYLAIKTLLVNTLAILILFAMSLESRLSTDCCKTENLIHHVCVGLESEVRLPGHKFWALTSDTEYWIRNHGDKTAEKCISRFCNDLYSMTHSDFYCGQEKCNLFGCNCNGGCRKNNDSDFQTFEHAFAKEHGFVKKSRHRVFEVFFWND